MRMLIVDDNKTILKMLADFAIKEGYIVDTATDVVEDIKESTKDAVVDALSKK